MRHAAEQHRPLALDLAPFVDGTTGDEHDGQADSEEREERGDVRGQTDSNAADRREEGDGIRGRAPDGHAGGDPPPPDGAGDGDRHEQQERRDPECTFGSSR